jgi:segregation and condensation protein A
MGYDVKLDVFEGPLDLLLHLITRQRVDIYEVSLASITEDYIAALARVDDLDLESATGFLVVAATLLELKSSRLLPSSREGDDDGRLLEERDLLLARLVECATFRDAGAWLRAALAAGDAYHPRRVSLEEPFIDLAPDLLANISARDVSRTAGSLLLVPDPGDVDVSHLAPITASVADAIAGVAGDLRSGAETSFEDLCWGRSRIDVVVRFLALLELFKAGAVEIEQADRFGAIRARWTGRVDVASVVEEAEEYSAEGRA